MRKYKSKFPIFFQMITLVLIGAALLFSSAQAQPFNPLDGKDPAIPETNKEKTSQTYDPSVYQGAWGTSPDMLVNCSLGEEILANLSPAIPQTAHKLEAMACKNEIEAALYTASLDFSSEEYLNITGYNGVGGETKMLKIFPAVTDTRYVYLQCGKKVSVIQPPSCCCSAGNWRYINSCKGIKTIYVTIPCH